jgi:hypothetical protein
MNAKFIGIAVLAILLGLPTAYADEDMLEDPTTMALGRKLSVGIAAGLMRFDTNFKFTRRDTGRSVFLDSEGSMDLPEVKSIPLMYGYWRPSPKHGLGFGYFSVHRESELIAIDRNFGDLSVDGRASLDDDTRFYTLAYNYTLFQDSRAFLFASLGITAIDLKYDFDAFGVLSIDDVPVATGAYTESLEQFAPIPLIGLDAWFAITNNWSFGARAISTATSPSMGRIRRPRSITVSKACFWASTSASDPIAGPGPLLRVECVVGAVLEPRLEPRSMPGRIAGPGPLLRVECVAGAVLEPRLEPRPIAGQGPLLQFDPWRKKNRRILLNQIVKLFDTPA